jgi:hypothetical protein
MEKRTKRKARGQDRGQVRRYRVIREQITARQRADIGNGSSLRRTCFDCVFCISNALLWAQTLMSGFALGGQCANHPDTPGQVRRIPGTPCRNFRGKPLRLDPPEPPNDKIRYIPLTRGLFAIVDAEDYEWLSKYKWHAGRPTRAGKIYARRSTHGGGVILMHRMIMNPPKGMVVDHINGNTLDNRRCNLWVCTQAENIQNGGLHKGAKNRFKGVYPNGRKWYGRVKYKGETYYLGLFDDEVEAAKARDRKALELYGKHAWLNFPPENPEADLQGLGESR